MVTKISYDEKKVYVENIGNTGLTFDLIPNEVVSNVLYSGATLLELSKLRFWCSAGTALGLYRDGKPIEHDTDIDFEVGLNWEANNSQAIIDLMRSFLDNGFATHRIMEYEGKTMQLAFIKDNVVFDIYFMYSGVELHRLVNFNEHGIYDIPFQFIVELTEHEDLPFPSPIEEYLEYRYGSDWKTPKGSKGDWSEDCKCLRKQ